MLQAPPSAAPETTTASQRTRDRVLFLTNVTIFFISLFSLVFVRNLREMCRVAVLLCLSLALSNAQELITFDLNDYDPGDVPKKFVNVSSGVTEIVVNYTGDTGFFVVQAHSYIDNVTLSSSRKFKSKDSVTGTNVGLVGFSGDSGNYFVKAQNSTLVLFTVVAYGSEDPIPGGCNLSFETEYAPYQVVSYTDDLIVAQSQAPSAFDSTCDKNNIQVDLYHLFLHENNYESSGYFIGIIQMLTVDSIKVHGFKVNAEGGQKYRKLYSLYKGVGEVFAIVATYGNRSSAYVPALSYGCDIRHVDLCSPLGEPYWSWIVPFLLLFGIFLTFFGHRFFTLTLGVVSFVIGAVVVYLVLAVSLDNVTAGERITVSAVIAVICTVLWLRIWWKYGIPIISVGTALICGEFLLASMVFYSIIADLGIFRNNTTFWLTFIAIMIAFHMLWSIVTMRGHIVASSLLGAYAIVFALNHYIGGYLQYILINSFRRLVVPEFNSATIDPPYQIFDVTLSILLILLVNFGFYYQMRHQHGRSPFPSHRFGSVAQVGESAPLLGGYISEV